MPSDPPLLLHHWVEETARRQPGRVAVEVPPGPDRPQRRRITYSQLAQRAANLARRLRPVARRDAVVAVLLPRESLDLYPAQLAILSAGAAFTCLDPRFPDAQIAAVLRDGAVAAVVTDGRGRQRLAGLGAGLPALVAVEAVERGEVPGASLDVDVDDPAIPVDSPVVGRPGDWGAAASGVEGAAPVGAEQRAEPSSLAYVIYTSGTTGRPKGVMIEHRSIVNLVQSDVAEFGLTPNDRVAQCSSPAYDSSIEEAWLAFAVGATLVVLDDDTVRLGPDLVPWLRREAITVFCPPPTLLRATGCPEPAAALPALRLLYVGGEALPQDLADLWSVGRRMVNGYGPTECAVTATRSPVVAGRPVTIGRPVPGNVAWVLDEGLEPVPDGEAGELCIGGRGLARGYQGLPDVTAQRFPTHPRLGRIYRTGDLVRRNRDGDLEYLGRLDGQVKLRGYRVELGAVEAALAAEPGVRAAGCRLQGSGPDQVLVAHVVPENPAEPPRFEELRAALRQRLPEYMVPARLGWLDALPTGVSGKLERRALPDVGAAGQAAAVAPALPEDPLEKDVADAFGKALGLGTPISVQDDFFLDLGGESLRAVAAIVALREAGYASVAVRDVYEARTARALADRLRGRPADGPLDRADSTSAGPPSAARPRVSRAAVATTTLLQAVWLLGEVWAGSVLAYVVAYGLLPWLIGSVGLIGSLVLAPILALAGLAVYVPLSVALAVAVKRLLIGRYRPTRAPVWGGFYLRHWIVAHTARGIPWGLLAGTALYGVVLRALGARVGKRVHFHRGVDFGGGGWDLLRIGDDVTLGQDASPRLAELEDGHLVLGPVTVGAGATVGTRAGLSPGAAMGEGSYLTDLSWLPAGADVPAGSRWDGVPAGPAGEAPPAPNLDGTTAWSPVRHGAAQLAATGAWRWLGWLPLIVVAVAVTWAAPGVAARLLAWLYGPAPEGRGPTWIVVLLPALALPVALLLQALALRVSGGLRPAVVDRWGPAAIQVWLRTGAVAGAAEWLSGALFWPSWLRLAGMRIGPRAEVSTVLDTLPETVSIGDESFFADGIYLGQPRYHRGTITVASTMLGRRTFLGNHAVVPAGHVYPEDYFLGAATVPDPAWARPDTGWFGHPPLALPRRAVVEVDRRLTYEPDRLRYATRVFWELLRFALPILPWALLLAWMRAVTVAAERVAATALVGLVVPAVTLATLAVPCLAVVALKWLLLGRAKPGQHPFWSCWCGRWDFLYVAWGRWARGILARLEGTLLLNAYLRWMGMDIGRRVILGPGFAQVVDPDMLHFEDHATVACQFQAHSFEDRILKIDHLHIRRGATVGAHTVVFYGADVGPGAWVGPHGVIMKGDVLPGGREYVGHPVRADRGHPVPRGKDGVRFPEPTRPEERSAGV